MYRGQLEYQGETKAVCKITRKNAETLLERSLRICTCQERNEITPDWGGGYDMHGTIMTRMVCTKWLQLTLSISFRSFRGLWACKAQARSSNVRR